MSLGTQGEGHAPTVSNSLTTKVFVISSPEPYIKQNKARIKNGCVLNMRHLTPVQRQALSKALAEGLKTGS